MLRQAQHERIWGTHALSPHPAFPARSVTSVSVEVRSSSRHTIGLLYRVKPAHQLAIPDRIGGPVDGLWQTTCFELFVRSTADGSYREFNFAPVGGWAAYAFSGWRADMTPLSLHRPPTMIDGRDESRRVGHPEVYEFLVYIDRDSWPHEDCMVALTAVIEETDGTKSYWSLAHPPGLPDFHHPDCFALHIPAVA